MTATGVGSLPGDDIDAALALVFTELPELPHLPELPARGPGADMVGRAAAALVDLHVDLQPSGWRLVPRAGQDERRAVELLERDLDALVPVAPGHDGPFKVQLAGPWTLAATVELPRGGLAVVDPGARRDLLESHAETVRTHLAEVRRRLPAAQLVLQLDEPALPAVLAGRLPTASGYGRLPAVEASLVEDGLRSVVAAAEVPVVVHCCDRDVPWRLLRGAGAHAVSYDAARAALDRDDVGELVEGGLGLWAGVVPSTQPPGMPRSSREVAQPVTRLWRELTLDPALLPSRVTVTPACGLAGASPEWARAALRLAREVATVLSEAPEGVSS